MQNAERVNLINVLLSVWAIIIILPLLSTPCESKSRKLSCLKRGEARKEDAVKTKPFEFLQISGDWRDTNQIGLQEYQFFVSDSDRDPSQGIRSGD